MSAATPNLETFRQQSVTALATLIGEGTADPTTANIIEVLHGVVRRLELLEASAPQYTTITQQITPDLPAGFAQVSMTQSTGNPGAAAATITTEPAAEEAHTDGVSPETPA